MNLRSLLFRVAMVTALLGFAYTASVGARRADALFAIDTAAAPKAVLLPLIGLPLVYLQSLP